MVCRLLERQRLRMLLAECARPIAVDGVPAQLKVVCLAGAVPPPGAYAVHGLVQLRPGSGRLHFP